MEPALENNRIASVDALRGLTIFIMIWVNQMAGVADISPWWKHMPTHADAMTFVDAVFPAFLFVVGLSIPFAMNARRRHGDSVRGIAGHVLVRTVGLWVIGIFLVNAEMGADPQRMIVSPDLWLLAVLVAVVLVWNRYPKSLSPRWAVALRAFGVVALVVLGAAFVGRDGGAMRIHWWGILGLIGWAYLYACIAYGLCRGKVSRVLLAIGALIVFHMLVSPAFMGRTDGWLRVLQGQAGNASHTAIVMCGVAVSLLMFDKNLAGSMATRLLRVFGLAALLALCAAAIRPYFPISKNLGTPSWALFSAAGCCVTLALLHLIVSDESRRRWWAWLQPVAAHPLLTYLVPYALFAAAELLGVPLTPAFASSGVLGIVYCLLFALAVVWAARAFDKVHLQLRL